MMNIEINNDSLKQGVLGLVLVLAEIIKDTLKIQACRRMDSGSLNEEEIERLGLAIRDLEEALESLKIEQNLVDVVEKIRTGLDDVVNEVVDTFNPVRWFENDEDE